MKKAKIRIKKDLKIVEEALKIFRDKARLGAVQQLIIFEKGSNVNINIGGMN
jgi:hypothetical protein